MADVSLDDLPAPPKALTVDDLPAPPGASAPQYASLPQSLMSAALRPVIGAVTAVPGMAADAGVALRNIAEQGVNKYAPSLAQAIYGMNRKLAGNSPLMQAILPQGPPAGNYQSLTSGFNQQLDRLLPAPSTTADKAANFINTALVGSQLAAPQVSQRAPSNFTNAPDVVKQGTLQASQKAGYVVPPSTTNPSLTNKILESIAGKDATAQEAALRNVGVTNSLARRALGLSEDSPLTQEAIEATRSGAGDAYAMLRKIGDVPLDDSAKNALDAVAARYSGNALTEAISGGTDIPKIVNTIKSEPLNGDNLVDAMGALRDKASSAFASGDKALGNSYRKISDTLEGLIQRSLPEDSDVLQQFKDARQLIAKTYSVEKAFNPSTGNVSALKLGQQLSKKAPLDTDLLTAGRFGQAFPKASREVVDSGPVRNTDVLLGAGVSALSREPTYLLYPFVRQAVRAGLLSPTGQQLAVSGGTQIPPSLPMGLFSAGNSLRTQ